MRKTLWNKDFILMLQGSAVSAVGDLMYGVAIGYWVYEKTGSSALMGIMSSISMFVTMFLSPFAGSVVDKCNRKWLIVLVDALQGLLMLAVGALAYLDRLNVPGVLAVALLAAFGNVFYSPAVSTLMIDIIPEHDMVRGRSLHSGIHSMINLVGSAFSGAMVAFFGVPLIVVINGLSNLYSAVTELFVRVPRTAQQGMPVTVKSVLQDTATAIRSIFADPFMRLFVPGVLIINLLVSGAFSLMLPFCLEKDFTLDMYGYLMSVETAASLVAVLVLGVVKLTPRIRFWAMGSSFVVSVAIWCVAFLTKNFAVLCVCMFLGGALNMVGNTVFNASLMLALPEENRGAILGFISAACTGGVALSAVIFGALGEFFPLHLVFLVGTLLSLLPTVYVCFHKRTKAFMLEH